MFKVIAHVQILVIGLAFSLTAMAEQVIRIGVFPRYNYTETLRMLTPLANHLSKQLNRPVQLIASKNFFTFWDKVVHQQFDLIYTNQLQYLAANKKYHYTVVAKNEEFNSAKIASVIVVHKSSGIKNLSDLKHKRIIFGGNETAMMSYKVPKAMLDNSGVYKKDYQSLFALNPPNALLALSLGQADACGIGEVILRLAAKRQEINMDDFTILAKSESFPHLAWAVRASMDANLKRRMIQALTHLHQSQAGRRVLERAGLTGIKPAQHDEYVPLLKYTGEL